MFNEYFKENNEFIYKFFSCALEDNNKKLSHAYIFEGNCLYTQYYSALTIAKILNCKGDKSKNCDCVNCRWINENKHPEVITVSQYDYIEDKKSSAKSNIPVSSIRRLREELSKTSEYKRVVIFTGAKELKKESLEYTAEEKEQDFWKIKPPSSNTERAWGLEPLNSHIFRKESANAFLKTLEEPPSNVIFFFLTNDKTDLIPTIISRCHSIKFPYKNQSENNDNKLIELFGTINIQSYKDVIRTAEKVTVFSKEHNTSIEYLLGSYEKFLEGSIKNNQHKITPLANILKNISQARIELKAKVNPNSVLENLFASFL